MWSLKICGTHVDRSVNSLCLSAQWTCQVQQWKQTHTKTVCCIHWIKSHTKIRITIARLFSCSTVAPERILKCGQRIFLSCPSTSLALQIQLAILTSAFVMVSTVGPLVVFCSTHSAQTPTPSKSGEMCPFPLPLPIPCLMELAPLLLNYRSNINVLNVLV